MEILDKIISLLTLAVSIFTSYQIVYLLIGFFSPKVKYARSDKKYRYAVIICARNEENVIGKLLDSIKNQTYAKDKITIFVCADNCTDKTAEICRKAGCIVYERPAPHPSKARKGYALEYLFDRIRIEYDIERFDGFAFFDADNVLAPDWFDRMNDAFACGAGIITTYRNTKNFDTNFISAAYGIHFYRSTVKFHRARRRLGASTHIAGTGYVMRSRLLRDGWHFTGLTEDTQATQYYVSRGERIEFCEDAEFFDEQPHGFKIMFRQRLRWSKGRLVVFLKHGWRNLLGLFTQKSVGNVWANYDIFWYLFPGGLFSALLSVISFAAGVAVAIVAGIGPAHPITGVNAWDFFENILIACATGYAGYTVIAAITVIRERKHIYCSTGKKILYIFTFFWFDLINLPISVISLFMRVRWKPIVHDKSLDYDQIVNNKQG